VRATTAAPLAALELTVNVAALASGLAGVKRTVMVQVASTASEAGQSLV
jgi:hypothetical protein